MPVSGEQLRLKRKRKKVSLCKLARETGISPSYLSDIELGRRTCPPSTMERLTDTLAAITRA